MLTTILAKTKLGIGPTKKGVLLLIMQLIIYFSSTDIVQVQVKTLKKNHPAVVMVATFCLGWFLVYQFGCILVFLSGVIFPFLFMIVHASLRLRNAKNKVNPFFVRIFILTLNSTSNLYLLPRFTSAAHCFYISLVWIPSLVFLFCGFRLLFLRFLS